MNECLKRTFVLGFLVLKKSYDNPTTRYFDMFDNRTKWLGLKKMIGFQTNLPEDFSLVFRIMACVLSWLNILDRIYKLTSLDYFWTKVVVCGNLVPTNNSDK